jgi:hypothetical protein
MGNRPSPLDHASRRGHRRVPRYLFIILLLLDFALPSCGPTVRGPESSRLLIGTEGLILLDKPVGGIVAYELPARREIQIRKSSGDVLVWAVGGPDTAGHIVYAVNCERDAECQLRVRDMWTGEDSLLREWKNRNAAYALGHGGLSLSPTSNVVAVVSDEPGDAAEDYREYWRNETLSLISIPSGERKLPGIRAYAGGLSWGPASLQLAYVELRDWFSPTEEGIDIGLKGGFTEWGKLPVIRVLDVASGTTRPICIGYEPAISPSGDFLLARDGENHWRRVNIRTRKGGPVNMPGNSGCVVSMLSDDLVLYCGYITAGQPRGFTKYGSFRGPLPLETLKICDLRSGAFQTVLKGIDPRASISYGR